MNFSTVFSLIKMRSLYVTLPCLSCLVVLRTVLHVQPCMSVATRLLVAVSTYRSSVCPLCDRSRVTVDPTPPSLRQLHDADVSRRLRVGKNSSTMEWLLVSARYSRQVDPSPDCSVHTRELSNTTPSQLYMCAFYFIKIVIAMSKNPLHWFLVCDRK